MQRTTRIIALLACAAGVSACVPTQAELRIDLPLVLPPLVTVEPGVQVVEDHGEEIFFVDGYYWVRRGDYWYRASDPHARWIYVERRVVPAAIVRIPPGRYALAAGPARSGARGGRRTKTEAGRKD
jgi:hypothetical protein